MMSYYELELLANERVHRRRAEADRERMLTSAQRAKAVVWWGLPWLVLLAISAGAAYGMTVSTAGAESVPERLEPVSAPSEPCDTTSRWILLNAVANGWIPTRSAGYCGDG